MQRVAEAVAGDPAGCAALTVTGLAELTGTSEATVVRTARLLGYPGYRDLRLALAGLAAHQQSGRAPAVTADIAVDDPIADVVAKLAYDEQQTLADTAAGLDTVQLGAAVAAAGDRPPHRHLRRRRLRPRRPGPRAEAAAHRPHRARPQRPAPRRHQRRAAARRGRGDRDHPLRVDRRRHRAAAGRLRPRRDDRRDHRPPGRPGRAVRRPRADHLHRPRERAAPGRDVVPHEPAARRGLPVHRRRAAYVRDGGPRALRLVRGAGAPPHAAPRQPASSRATPVTGPARPGPENAEPPCPYRTRGTDAARPCATCRRRTPSERAAPP